MKRKGQKKPKKSEGKKIKEYGIVLTKEEKYRHRIYPQKGKPPKEDKEEDSYRVV